MPAKYKKRADGRYLIQILVGYTREGKPKYKNVYAYTVKELEEKAAKVRAEIEKGIVINDQSLTLEMWARRWFELYKANLAHNTRNMYLTALNYHICPQLGMLRLKDVKPHHVQECVNKLLANGKARTAQIVCITLNQMLAQAVKNEYIYKNVMDAIAVKKPDKPKKRALTDVEVTHVRNAELPLKEKVFVILLLTTGLRKGEALALTKSDIDMENRTITVGKSVVIKSNRMEIKNAPKSKAGNRVVPVTDELYQYMSEYLPTMDGIYMFPTARNGFMTHTAFRRMWERIRKAINLAAGGTSGKLHVEKIAGDITPHIFRHTYATMLYRAGVDIKTAQYLLGHSSIQLTMEIYTHLNDEKKEEEIRKFNTYMNNAIQSEISQSEIV